MFSYIVSFQAENYNSTYFGIDGSALSPSVGQKKEMKYCINIL